MFNSFLSALKDLIKRKRKFFNLYLIVFCWNILLFLFFIGIRKPLHLTPEHIEIYTGTQGGLYNSRGEMLTKLFDHNSMIKTHVYKSDGDLENYDRLKSQFSGNTIVFNTTGVVKLLQNKEVSHYKDHEDPYRREMSIVLPLKGKSILYMFKQESLEYENINAVWDCTRNFDDTLRMYLGKPESGTFILSKEILQMAGNGLDGLNLIYKPYQGLSFEQAAEKLIKNDLDVVFMYGNYDEDYDMPAAKKLMGSDNVSRLKWSSSGEGSLDYVLRKLGPDYFQKYTSNNQSYISSKSVLLTHEETNPYVIWNFIKGIGKNAGNLQTSLDELNNLETNEIDNIPLHRGTARFKNNPKKWSLWYSIKQWLPWFALTLVIVLFGVQLYSLFQINHLIRKEINDDLVNLPNHFSKKQMVIVLLSILIATTLILMIPS